MKDLTDLYEAELKNLYALEKQIQSSLQNDYKVKNERLKKRLDKFTSHNEKDFQRIQKVLQKQEINPGSTTDSVAQEILDNISTITNETMKSTVKEAGLVASLIRLSAYKTSNYLTAYRIAKALNGKRGRKKLKKTRKNAERDQSKFTRIARKYVYKEAVSN